MKHTLITADMISRYSELSKQKKKIETEMNSLKEVFNAYFDVHVGENSKGELIDHGFKLQRQIRKTERYNEAQAVQKLEAIQMHDLIQTVKRPDDKKIEAAISLGFLTEDVLANCKEINYSKAISVKEI